MDGRRRIAGAPVSWGVIGIPDWGYRMSADRVLHEAASAGLTAMEAGPEGFLPRDSEKVSSMLATRGLELAGGFVSAVLHVPEMRGTALRSIEERAGFIAAAGGDVLVVAADTNRESYQECAELDDESWEELFANLSRVEGIAARHGLTVALHPHYGTVVESDGHLQRLLDGCDIGLCLDTGHLIIGGSDPAEVAEYVPARIKHVHLKDVDRGLATRLGRREIDFKEAVQQGVFPPLGEGDVDVDWILDLLERAGYGGWYVLERDVCIESEPEENAGSVVGVRKSLEYMERHFERIGERAR